MKFKTFLNNDKYIINLVCKTFALIHKVCDDNQEIVYTTNVKKKKVVNKLQSYKHVHQVNTVASLSLR